MLQTMSASTSAVSFSAPATARPRVVFALLALWIVWGSTYLAMRIAVETLPPLSMAGVRYLLAGAVVLGLARARGQSLPTRREWVLALPVGALMFLVGNGLIVIAERTLPSSLAATACATTPLLVTAINAVRGERPQGRELLGMLLGFVGVLVLAGGSMTKVGGPLGMLALVAPIGWALGSVVARTTRTTGFSSAGAQMIAGGATMVLCGALLGERLPDAISMRSVAAWLHLVVFGSIVGYSSYIYLLRNARPSVAMSYAYVNPALAMVLGATLGGEKLGFATLVSTTLIAVGVAVGMRVSGRSPAMQREASSRCT
jgi:drug/metabolite transporter (DMT)-like permease